ncbi:MAG: transcriptional regulator [Candidatus Competibacteraceae bacterium]|nr:MAG: transcriptional regulator [Candidatus Competibacteraceae bacterium]
MFLQITNPVVVDKVERLARATGSSKAAAVEPAVAKLPRAMKGSREATERFAVLLAQIDRIPERPDACDPLEWDERGLPR